MREISSECPSTSALPPVEIEGESANVIDESFEEFVSSSSSITLFIHADPVNRS